jgi:Predicted hydrolases or acyltransferases (alpha/beta hydrolase superfamily)
MKKRYWIAGAVGVAAGAAVTAKLLSRPAEVLWDDHAQEIPHASHSRFALIEGARVHYQDAGAIDAPPLVLIHGFCASTHVWRETFLPLAENGFRVIVPDLLGYGFSEKPRAGDYTFDSQARMIALLMEHLGIESATLVGSSYGGAVAATCALDFPEKVSKLVLVGAVINDEPVRQPMARLVTAPLIGDLLTPFMVDSERLSRWRQKKKVWSEGSPLAFDEERIQARHRPLRSSSAHRAVLRTLRNWSATRIQQEAHSIKQPTLLVWGDSDNEIPLRNGEILNEAMPDARLVIFRHCGHLPQEEYPDKFVELIAEFAASEKKIEEQQSELQMSVT